MTAKELFEFQVGNAGYQLNKCFEGMPESAYDDKATEASMTPRETLSHLSEAYEAVIAEAEGRKHNWGTFSIEDQSVENLKRVFDATRSKAIAAVLAKGDDLLKEGHAYITAHDYYHVGQLCALRLRVDPSFDAYSIYQH